MTTTRKTSESTSSGGSQEANSQGGAAWDRIPLKAVTDRVREFNDRVTQSYREVGLAGVGAYDRAIKTVADLENRTASAAKVGWVETAVRTHSELLQDLGTSYAKAARSLLS